MPLGNQRANNTFQTKMVSIENVIDSFIAEHSLDSDEIKEPIISLVNKCIEGIFKHVFTEPIPEPTAPKTKSQKVLKADKIEDPSTVENRDDLHNCTTGVLNNFCKENSLKVGGNKAELMNRVWRFLQGETSDDDKSSRGKSKAPKKTNEKHECSGCNAKGQPCGVAGTEFRNGMWFCWRHITEADTIADTKEPKEPKAPKDQDESGPAAAPKKKPSSKKKKAPVAELVTDEE